MSWCPLQFPHKNLVRLYPWLCCRRAYVLFTLLYLVAHSGDQQNCPTHIVLCFCFVCPSPCVMCTCCQLQWTVNFWLQLRFSLTFIFNSLSILSSQRNVEKFNDPGPKRLNEHFFLFLLSLLALILNLWPFRDCLTFTNT